LARLQAHVARLRAAGLPVFQAAHPAARGTPTASGTFMLPTLIELGGLDGFAHLAEEVFGPVLHVVCWRRAELGDLIERINATGYALTHGIHTRIDETVTFILGRVHAGNVYVNRNMIGAVVGVQPFGGSGLSGTGPKAGGPLYLRRLVRTATPVRFPPDMRRVLPGATGETNEIQFRPRGAIACLAEDERGLRAQAKAAQAVGNTVVMMRSHLTLGMRHGLDPARLQLVDTLDFAEVDAVLANLPVERMAQLRTQVAAGEGHIVPVITPDRDGNYDAARLVVERTVTINTAAAGGNARLIATAAEER